MPLLPRLGQAVTPLAVLCIVAASCTATATVTVDETVTLDDTVQTEAASTLDDVAPDDGPAGDSAAESDSAPAGGDECQYLGIDEFGDMQIELRFAADLADQDDVNAKYAVLDPSGNALTSGETFIEDLKPAENLRIHVDTLTSEPDYLRDSPGITCEFQGLEPVGFVTEPFRPGPGDSCQLLGVDQVDDIQIEITVANPIDVTTELAIDYALRGPGGVRFADSVAYSDFTDVGDNTTLEVDTFTEFPDWVDATSFTCDVLAIQDS